jgi:hypothetical protein
MHFFAPQHSERKRIKGGETRKKNVNSLIGRHVTLAQSKGNEDGIAQTDVPQNQRRSLSSQP